MRKQLPIYIIMLLLVFWAALLPASAAMAAKPDLVITGTGLHKDVEIYPGDWGKYKEEIRDYSSNNTMDYHRIWKVKGYDLKMLMGGESNIKSGNHNITFIADDKVSMTKKRWDLFDRYYHENFTKPIPVAPMIAFYRADVYQHNGLPDPGEVVLQNRSFEWDGKAPRIYLGQQKGKVSEETHTIFIGYLVRIVVGEERSEAKKQVKTDKSKSSGSATAGKGGAGKTDSRKAGTRDEPAGEAAAEKESKESESGNHKDETALGQETEKGAAAGHGGDDSSEIEEAAKEQKEQPRRARWPWVAAGVAAVTGLTGGGIYYYIRRRGA